MKRKDQTLEKILIVIAILSMMFTLWFLSSCTPQHKLNRLAKRHPEIFKRDTIVIKDTLIIENAFLDTLFIPGNDTVIFREGRLRVKHHYDTITKKVFLEGECETDTVYKERKVVVEKAVVVEGKSNIPWWIYVIIVGLVLGIIFKK